MKWEVKILEKPTKTSAGKAIIDGKICHYLENRWIKCGDCNK